MESFPTSASCQFSLTCTVRTDFDGCPRNTTIQWTRITLPPSANTSETVILEKKEYTEEEAFMLGSSSVTNFGSGSEFYSGSVLGPSSSTGSGSGSSTSSVCPGSADWGYQSVLNTSENDTADSVIYRCTAISLNISNSSDTSVKFEVMEGIF